MQQIKWFCIFIYFYLKRSELFVSVLQFFFFKFTDIVWTLELSPGQSTCTLNWSKNIHQYTKYQTTSYIKISKATIKIHVWCVYIWTIYTNEQMNINICILILSLRYKFTHLWIVRLYFFFFFHFFLQLKFFEQLSTLKIVFWNRLIKFLIAL